MPNHTLYILDVFAESKYAGNQLAVVRNAADLSSQEMQKITREINFSETTFILSDQPRDGGWDVRIFTPGAEVPFAGHPTLGTAYVIQHEIIKKQIDSLKLNLKVGQIPVRFDYDGSNVSTVWLKPIDPIFGEVFDAREILNISTIARDDIDDRFPIQTVSTGLPFIFVPLKTLDAVKRASTVKEKLFHWVKDKEAKMIFVFCPQTYDTKNHLNARMFGDYYGIAEDPATGSANSCLAPYLVKYRYFGTDTIDIRVEQGYEIGRPSLLYLKAACKDDKFDISVGGKVIMTAKGELV
jgi:trans-2,3-dihydro-3-hydroxyanthranilate isomerase